MRQIILIKEEHKILTKNNYRVLHIFSSYGGGISSLVLNLTKNKSEDFIFDVMTFSYKNGEAFVEHIRKAGGEAYLMPRPRIDGYRIFKKFIDGVISENKYDAIHCHITGWHAIPFVKAAKKYGVEKFIFHAHTTRYDSRIDRIPIVSLFNKFFNYKNSSTYMTCSDLAAKYIFGEKYLKKRKAFLIPNGLNEDLFSYALSDEQKKSYYQEFNISEKTFVIGHVGRFSYPKNHLFMLEIMKKLKDNRRNCVLVFVGDGELLDSVRKRTETENLSDYICFAGRRTDISALMQFFDCMLLPSICEGLPTVAVECQATGTHMILSDSITKQCDMDLDLLGFLPANDVNLWVESLENLSLNNHRNKSDCLAQIRSRGFTAKESGKKYCSLLKEIIDNPINN